MSRIFDALRKQEGEIGRLAMPLLGEQVSLGAPLPMESAAPAEAYAGAVVTEVFPGAEFAEVQLVPVRLAPASPVLPFDNSDSQAAEQYRIIRTKILQHPLQPRVLLMSSPMPGDGKTVSAINLAGALALHEDVNVLLVDGDSRRSSVAGLLGIRQSPGLGEVLRGAASLEQALIRTEQIPNLYVLAAGDAGPNPAEVFSSARWHALLDVMKREFRFTVFDAPPVATVADYDLLQVACDGVVLVVRPDHTNRRLFRRALATVPAEKQLGVILNCTEEWFLWKTNSYYYYSRDPRP